MGVGKYLLLFSSLASILYTGNGCQMDGIGTWLLTQDAEILDTFSGTFWSRNTSSIIEISDITVGGAVNYARYLDIDLNEEGLFTISTSPGYTLYEENETSEFMSFTVRFVCTGGTSNSLIFSIRVQDTNNNPPTFRPTDQYDFAITPPLPPGFQITGCAGDDIVVRDIDLTTSRIDFTIEDNPYFEIAYEGRSSTDPKEFLASLKTKDLIRSLSEDLELTISATDVDATGDLPITTYATIRIRADEEFLFPEEPVFTQPFYEATFTNNQVVLEQLVSLQQGFDDEVTFYLEGEHSEHFELVLNGNSISIGMTTTLSNDILASGRVILVVRAEREYTSGATTTIIVQLPEARELAFESPTYIGTLQDASLNLEPVTLSTGYAEDVDYNLNGDHGSYFTLSTAQNEVTINLSAPLPEDVILENNFLILTLMASGLHAVPTSTTILLEIIKQDLYTPVFSETIYSGSYLGANSIEIDSINLTQGYDNSVTFRLAGEHSQYFEITNDANNLNLVPVSIIPPDVIFEEKVLLFSILAEKPLTVGASAVISITFPQDLTDAAVMRFSSNLYLGSLENNILTLGNIVLESGYEIGTEFSLDGEFATYFQLQNTENIISISIQNPLTEEILENNTYIILDVEASRERAVSVSASVVIDIVKQEIVPTAFSNAYYESVYADGHLQDLTITLSEGYDDTVTFELQGNTSTWFSITNEDNIVQLSLNNLVSIPEDILENNEYFIFSIVANKPNTINANAAIFINVLKETPETALVQFSQTSYVGRIENSELYAPAITLLGEREPIYFNITGDYAYYFDVTQVSANNVELRLSDGSLPEIIELIPFIVIDIEAQYPQAISGHTTVILEIVKESQIATPVFDEAYYTGEYSAQEGLQFEQSIHLSQGFDETVVFTLIGDDARWFEINNIAENNLTLVVSESGLQNILDRSHLVFTVLATRTSTVIGNAAVIINLIDVVVTTPLRFEHNFYQGTIENNSLSMDNIIMTEGFSSNLNVSFSGDHEEYFQLINQEGTFTIQLISELPSNIVDNNNVLVFTLEVQTGRALTHATIILELVKRELTPFAFEEIYYVGSYSIVGGFTFDPQITLIEGYDETVSFSLEGDDAQWFSIVENEYPLRLVQSNPIPNEVILSYHHLIFVISAEKPENLLARSTVIVSILNETEIAVLRFAETTYLGSIENDVMHLDGITLSEGYSQTVEFSLQGGLQNYFNISNINATVVVSLVTLIPENLIPSNRIIILELQAYAPNYVSAYCSIVLSVVQEHISSDILVFEEDYYVGVHTQTNGLTFASSVILSEGYDENITLSLEGDDSQYFEIVTESDNSVSLRLITPIPSAVTTNNHHLIFSIHANKPAAITGRATIVIALLDDYTEDMALLGFERISYIGSIENSTISLNGIVLSEGYSEAVSFRLLGDLESYFTIDSTGGEITLSLISPIPEDLVPENKIVVLELEASSPEAISAHATIILEVVLEEITQEQLTFSVAYYTGHYTVEQGLIFEDIITLISGYDENVAFFLEGDHSQYFETVVTGNSISLMLITAIPTDVVINDLHLIFTIRAEKPNALIARATIVIELLDGYTEELVFLSFNRNTYIGSLESENLNLDEITLSEGYSEFVIIRLLGDLQNYFSIISDGTSIMIILESAIPEQLLPTNRIIIMDLEASAPGSVTANAAIVIEVIQDEVALLEQLKFSEAYYTGNYTEANGLTFEDTITLIEGYDENVSFVLEGDYSEFFELTVTGNAASITLENSIQADILESNTKLIFVIVAQKSIISTRATIIISLIQDAAVCTDATFGNILYEGIVQGSEVRHETISVSGYEGTEIQLFGEYSVLFAASLSEGVVTIQAAGSATVPLDVSYVPLEVHAGPASAVLLLDVYHTENPVLPSVSFGSPSYAINTDVTHTGLVGRVSATADNGETVRYTLDIDNEHLLQRMTISEDGELHMWAPANSGIYSFHVRATTVFSQVSETANVLLTVEAITSVGDDGYILPPLQILDRDEESPHENLVPFDASTYAGCRFSLSNRWPTDQSWLYVDENGLHAHAIDREDESIAFMALSQVQVELILQCDSDNDSTIMKHSSIKLDERLGPYDYGNGKWILTDSINYSPRRSLVNLIVNDINDNYPIFIGKEEEPVVVGYPVPDLEEIILPRALAEVHATDADVGENAALVYWSTEEVLAVSPTTGSVHVRDIDGLQDDMRLTIHATDRNGQGLTGSLDLLVKLVDATHIAVVTVKGAFLDDENDILNNLTAVVGYEVKVLRSSVVSDAEAIEVDIRNKRDAIFSSGASLQLYVYGLIEREPVNVERLAEDINASVIETVIIASTVSLEDYLENLAICPLPGRDTALFVSTIVLAVLLFMLIVAAAVFFILKWKRKENYDEFSDENSLASRDGPALPAAKPEQSAPRMNIEDLKRSERRLQEMLDAPVTVAVGDEITVANQPVLQAPDKPVESKVNIQEPPIVIQSFDRLKDADDSDDGDEFGEKLKNRRKSVVTFNENVEKIIHVEDLPEDNDFEVFRL